MARLTEPLNLSKLAEEGMEFQIDADFVKDRESGSEEDDEQSLVKKLEQCNQECIGVFDEDVYEEGEPFQLIAKKMLDLVPDGKIKKRIIREGDGEKPSEYATVKINYNAYVEYDEHPFDSTYLRNRPWKFVLNDGRVIAGLDFAVQTMKLNEKSQFLIHPDYAYGKNCCIGRVPPNATVLFEVELVQIVHSGAAITYEQLPDEQKNVFEEVYKYSTALSEKGKRFFMDHEYKKAILNYNTAAARLEQAMIRGKEEKEQRFELSLKLYTNLLICYTRTKEARKGCSNAKKIYDLTENGELHNIHPKVYFNHAKCLRILGEYDSAKVFLDKAYRLEPKNPEIANEILNLEKDKADHKEKQVKFAKALVGTSN